MGSISPRDFIDVIYFKHYEENFDIICARSVDFPGYPPTSHYVRGYNYPSGYVCSPLKEETCTVQIIANTPWDGGSAASVGCWAH